jgi:uncharacterized protein
MPDKEKLQLRCPICKKSVATGSSDFPFCSERCRTIDLGRWASGDYVIPSPLTDTEKVGGTVQPEKDEDL